MGDIAYLKFNSIMMEDYETLALLLILKLSTRSTETPAPASAIVPAACSVTGCLNEISHAAGSTKSPSVNIVLKEGLLLEPSKQLQVLSKQGLRMCCLAVSTSQRTKTHQTDDNGQDSHADYGEID